MHGIGDAVSCAIRACGTPLAGSSSCSGCSATLALPPLSTALVTFFRLLGSSRCVHASLHARALPAMCWHGSPRRVLVPSRFTSFPDGCFSPRRVSRPVTRLSWFSSRREERLVLHVVLIQARVRIFVVLPPTFAKSPLKHDRSCSIYLKSC